MYNPFKKKAFNPFNQPQGYHEYSNTWTNLGGKLAKFCSRLLHHKMLYYIGLPVVILLLLANVLSKHLEERPNKFFYDEVVAFLESAESNQWLNVFYPLSKKDLQDYPMVFFFWQLDDIHSLSKLGYMGQIYQEFKDRAIIISIVSSRDVDSYTNREELLKKVREIIAFYNIPYPIVIENWQQNLQRLIESNSKHLMKKEDNPIPVEEIPMSTVDNGGENWKMPKVVLFDHLGNLVYKTTDEFDFADLLKRITHLVNSEESIKARKNVTDDLVLPVFQEQPHKPSYILSTPSGLSYIPNYSKIDAPAVVVADTGHDRVLIVSLGGEILDEIGSGKKTNYDGDYQTAGFYRPQGVDYYRNKIYVADTANNSVRVIDLVNKEVNTLLDGSVLNFPQDVKVLTEAETETLWISNSGKHELLALNLATGKIDKILKTEAEVIPFKMAKYGGSLYVIDVGANNLLRIENREIVETLKLDFKHRSDNKLLVTTEENKHNLSTDGTVKGGDLPAEVKEEAIPDNINQSFLLGIHVDDTGIYVSDYKNGNIYRLITAKRGRESGYSGTLYYNGKKDGMCETPGALVGVLDRFYVVDLDNDRIVVLNRNNNKRQFLNVVPTKISNRDIIGEYLHNVSKLPISNVQANQPLKLILGLPEGWEVNKSAPSFLELYAIQYDEADLVHAYSFRDIINSNKQLSLPALSADKEYYLHGTIYYCKSEHASLCLLRSFRQRIVPTNMGLQLQADTIELEFLL